MVTSIEFLLNIVVSLPYTAIRSAALTFCLSCLFLNPLSAQNDTTKLEVLRMAKIDTIKVQPVIINPEHLDSIQNSHMMHSSDIWNASVYINPYQLSLDPAIKKKRVITNTALHAGIYAGSMLVLNQAWYAGYPRSSFHTFNDNKEWQQVDKTGHSWSAYQISRTSMATWKWAGLNRKQQIWIGGLAGATFQTVIEVLDGFSSEWGWSWGDFTANCIGSGLLIGQQLGWNEQRISFKFSFHKMNYDDNMLNHRSDSLFGSSLPERALKDYNGQAYWLSANIKSFFPQSKIPGWLNVAVGYGASGMFGGYSNKWTEGSTSFDRSDIPRQRQWYLAPDIDFTRIRTKSKFLKSVFFVLNAFKLPAPALMLSNGKLKVHAIYF